METDELDEKETDSITSRRLKIRNAFVSGVLKIANDEDLRSVQTLFVLVGGGSATARSDVWRHFGPLYSEY